MVLPLTRRGWLLLLDWVPGPSQRPPQSLWGLQGGFISGAPFDTAVNVVSVAAGPARLGWLAVGVAIFVAGMAAGTLVGGSLTRRLGAGLLYAVNPFVFERVYAGQVALLLGYALLPLAVRSLLGAATSRGISRLRPGLWMAVLAALAPHFLWIMGVVLVGAAVERRLRPRDLGWLALVMLTAGLASSYLLMAQSGEATPVRVGLADLVAYRTRGDPNVGLFANVAGLYGFWRPEPQLPKETLGLWLAFLAVIGAVMIVGAVAAARRGEGRLLLVVLIAGGVGYLLALGDQGPTGSVYRWLFVHVPGFAVMREPQKFIALVALAYAMLFGYGAERVLTWLRAGWLRGFAGTMVLALPIVYTPTLFLGLGGQVRVSHYPQSWYEADRATDDGQGKILFLPWHQYLSFPFTGRIIANPANSFFARDVIQGDNVELPGLRSASSLTRSAYLEFLYSRGDQLCAFGRLVEPAGVEYVVVAKTLDWGGFRWLERQPDLELVLDRPEITVFRNLAYRGLGRRVTETRSVRDWGELVDIANVGQLGDEAVVAQRQAPGKIEPRSGECQRTPPVSATLSQIDVRRRSPVRYTVAGGPSGYVTLAEPFNRSWALDGNAAVELAGGLTAFPSPPGSAVIRFRHWDRVRLGYALSVATFIAVWLAGRPFRRSNHVGSRDTS